MLSFLVFVKNLGKFREIDMEFCENQRFYFCEIQNNFDKILYLAKFLKCCFAATQLTPVLFRETH